MTQQKQTTYPVKYQYAVYYFRVTRLRYEERKRWHSSVRSAAGKWRCF